MVVPPYLPERWQWRIERDERARKREGKLWYYHHYHNIGINFLVNTTVWKQP
jgi:hypothetical protein